MSCVEPRAPAGREACAGYSRSVWSSCPTVMLFKRTLFYSFSFHPLKSPGFSPDTLEPSHSLLRSDFCFL